MGSMSDEQALGPFTPKRHKPPPAHLLSAWERRDLAVCPVRDHSQGLGFALKSEDTD